MGGVTIKLGEGLDLPEKQAPTQTYGFIARKGAGKTYAAGRLVEELIRIGAPVIVIDPVGTWYGLGIAAGGKGPGLPIHVLGGEHGHLALDVARGEDIARVVVDNLSAVIDVIQLQKELSASDSSQRSPSGEAKANVIVFEEAQAFAPQRGRWRRRAHGRDLRGDHPARPQLRDRLHDDFAAPAEREQGGPEPDGMPLRRPDERLPGAESAEGMDHAPRHGPELVNELPSLPIGTMYVWSPQWLQILKKVKIAKKETFDASATPSVRGSAAGRSRARQPGRPARPGA
jgi:hypothetical protein